MGGRRSECTRGLSPSAPYLSEPPKSIVRIRPAVFGVGVDLGRHVAREAAVRELALELLADPGLFVGVLDDVASGVLDPFAVAGELPWRVHRQVAGRIGSQIEMLVKPAIRRDE